VSSDTALSEQHGNDHSAQAQRPPAAAGAFVAERLSNGWRLLANCQLGARRLQFVLIRPAAGVAVLEIDPVWTPNARDIFREHLAQEGFTSRFPGNLPVIHRRMRPGDVAMLDMLLAEAFIWLDPLSIDADAAWEDALQALLTPAPAAETTAIGATAPPEGLPVDTRSPKTREARLRRNAWIGLTAAGVAVMAIVFMPPKTGDAPVAPAVQPAAMAGAMPPQPSASVPAAMPAPPVTVAAEPLPEPPPPPVIDKVADITMPASPPVLLNAQPEAPDLRGAEVRPAPAPVEGIGAPVAERLAPLPEPPPVEGIGGWVQALPGSAAVPVEPPQPENLPVPAPPVPQTPPPAVAPPIPMPAAVAPPSAPEAPAPPLMAVRPTPAAAPAPNVPAPARPVASMSPAEVEAARRRGEALAALGDISGARRFLERAALAGSGSAALAMAESFDPQKLAERGVIGLSPDRATALTWYRHALALGVAEATPRIARLEAE